MAEQGWSRIARPRRSSVAILVLVLTALSSAVLAACGGPDHPPAGTPASASPAASPGASGKAQARRIRRFLRAQQHAVNMTAKAADIERAANSAMRRAVPESVPAEVDKALGLYHRAGAAYRRAITFMRAVRVPPGLKSFHELASAQSGYADVLDEWPQASWEGPPRGINGHFEAAWLHYKAVLRRYDAALIRTCVRAGVKPRPWLLVPPMGQSDSGM